MITSIFVLNNGKYLLRSYKTAEGISSAIDYRNAKSSWFTLQPIHR